MTNGMDWNGGVGDVWAAEWQRTDRSFAALTAELLAAVERAAPESGRAVDIGCGAGETALSLARAHPQLTVIGLDISDALVAVARQRGAGVANARFEAGDAMQCIANHTPVDLFLSRHGVMFFDDPVAAFAAFHAAASPDARLVFSCFRDWAANPFANALDAALKQGAPHPTAPGPFAFADESRVRGILGDAGWRNITATPVDFRYVAGAGADPVGDAVNFLTRIGPAARALRAMDSDARTHALGIVTRICEQHLSGGEVTFAAAAWIWTAQA